MSPRAARHGGYITYSMHGYNVAWQPNNYRVFFVSGHNKWSSIKHRKGAQDAKRSAVFNKLIRELVVAAKEGGADPTMNAALDAAVAKAKASNMPKDTMERAIKRGAGGESTENYERISYEGRGPGGVSFIIATLTDNKNRTVADLRHILSKHGGELTTTGSVSWNFERRGVVTIEGRSLDEDELLMACADAGADDFRIDGEVAEVYSAVENLNTVKGWFESQGQYTVKSSEPAMVPKETVELSELPDAKKVLKILDALEDNDDVQTVFSNWSMSDEVMEQAAAG